MRIHPVRLRGSGALIAASLLLAATTAGGASVAMPKLPVLGGVTSPNVRMLASIPTGQGVGGKFSGRYYFQTTARTGAGFVPSGVGTGGLIVFDVSRPETPLPVAFLPLPIWQNEDVDLSRERGLLLIASDRNASDAAVHQPGILFVVDISRPLLPRLRSALVLPATVPQPGGGKLGGPGHIVNCVLGCTYAYITGSRDRSVHVVDLRNPDRTKLVGTVATPAGGDLGVFTPGVVHDVNVDPTGTVWMAGSGGTAMYELDGDPLAPTLLASVAPEDNVAYNQLIHHGTLRLDATTVLIAEEAFDAYDCGGPDGAPGPQDGSLQTWRIDLATGRLLPLDAFDTAKAGTFASNLIGSCSAHWFDLNAYRVVASAWYEQGVRFLDVSDPSAIREVGYFVGFGSIAGQAQFVPGRPDLVYVSDYGRGLDIVQIDDGGVGAPTTVPSAKPLTTVPLFARMQPSPEFGWACRIPVAPRPRSG